MIFMLYFTFKKWYIVLLNVVCCSLFFRMFAVQNVSFVFVSFIQILYVTKNSGCV